MADLEILAREGIRLGCQAVDKWDAVRQSGALLVELGAVDPAYAEAMLEREGSVSTYIGEGVAIPHGTDASRSLVHRTTLGVLQFPDPIDWDGNPVTLCVAIASSGNEHIAVLSSLAEILMEPDQAEQLRNPNSVDDVLNLLAGVSA